MPDLDKRDGHGEHASDGRGLPRKASALVARISCVIKHHRWQKSQAAPGYETCVRCRRRRKDPETYFYLGGE